MTDRPLYDAECVLLMVAISGCLLFYLVRRLERGQEALRFGHAVAVAFALRFLGAAGIALTPFGRSLRGGDELLFLSNAKDLAHGSLFSGNSLDSLTSTLHEWVFGLQVRVLGDPPDLALRVTQCALAVAGMAFMVAAVHRLAGRRAATVAAWLLALEPTNIFFSSILHKEPLALFAEGLVAYGGSRFWIRADNRALLPLALGSAIAVATRPYAGLLLAAASGVVVLHASLRRRTDRRSPVIALLVTALIAVAIPAALRASSSSELSKLQTSQDANTTQTSANLPLERVDFSSRGKIISNLPRRVRDVILRPYPWQVEDTSQRLALVGTVVVLVGLWYLFASLVGAGVHAAERVAPLAYPGVLLLIAYSLSAGNAGTAFRYRTHVVGFMLAIVVVMRHPAGETSDQPATAPPVPAVAIRPP